MFIKYPSIENHYQEKWINRFIDEFGNDLITASYIVTEKLHGANIQLIFFPGEENFSIASRNQLTDGGFYNVGSILDTLDLTFVNAIANKQNTIVHLYGEVIGPGIQKGVDYGNTKQLRFFDMRIGTGLLTQQQFFAAFADNLEIVVPVIGHYNNLADAMAVEIKINSLLSDKEDNKIEGVVIKPWDKIFYNTNGSLFYIKKKNEEFLESKNREHKPKVEWSAPVNEWRTVFLGYLNEERVESVYSKEGRIDDQKLIGKYLGLVVQDAITTFEKEEDFDRELFEKNELKYIFKLDQTVRNILLQEVRECSDK